MLWVGIRDTHFFVERLYICLLSRCNSALFRCLGCTCVLRVCVCVAQRGQMTARVVQRRARPRRREAKCRTEKARRQVATSSGASARRHRNATTCGHDGSCAHHHHQTRSFSTTPLSFKLQAPLIYIDFVTKHNGVFVFVFHLSIMEGLITNQASGIHRFWEALCNGSKHSSI